MMNREEVFEKLNEVFRDVFDDDSIEIFDAMTAKDIEDFNQLRAAVYAQISLLDKFWLVSNADKINDLKNQIDQLKNINNPKPTEPQSGTTPDNTEPAKQETSKPTTPQTQPASGTTPATPQSTTPQAQPTEPKQ